MSKIFDEMDRLAEEKEATKEGQVMPKPCKLCGYDSDPNYLCPSCKVAYCADCVKNIKGHCACGYSWTINVEESHNYFTRETFESGAVRDKTDYRYDLMSLLVAEELLEHVNESMGAQKLAIYLLRYNNDNPSMPRAITAALAETLNVKLPDLAHFYAQALHERAAKYGERNWEKSIPESNLINHALHHLFKLVSGDQSENHRSHLVWNVLTLIHFRLQEQQEGQTQ